ncbi:MAG: biotin/lipoyl-containing protein [Bacteroidales bacterium]
MKNYKLKINGNDYNVAINDLENTKASVEVNGTSFNVEFEKPITKHKEINMVRSVSTNQAPIAPLPTPVSKPSTSTGEGTSVPSPLPGVILSVNCKEGDEVKKGQVILMLEAMKMENEIQSPINGKIKSINVTKGDSVLEGVALAVIE